MKLSNWLLGKNRESYWHGKMFFLQTISLVMLGIQWTKIYYSEFNMVYNPIKLSTVTVFRVVLATHKITVKLKET